MGVLDRYRKQGGFVQLLRLIETFGPQKQQKFLQMIEDENPRWAEKIREKMLTVDRIFSWEEAVIAEIVPQLPAKHLAIAMHGLDEEKNQKIFTRLSHQEKRQIEDAKDAAQPTQPEISTTFVKIIEKVRDLIKSGHLRAEQIDETLVIPEDIEDQIANHSEKDIDASGWDKVSGAQGSHSEEEEKTAEVVGEIKSEQGSSEKVEQLNHKLKLLAQENKSLKQEVKRLKDKLEQIKNIA